MAFALIQKIGSRRINCCNGTNQVHLNGFSGFFKITAADLFTQPDSGIGKNNIQTAQLFSQFIDRFKYIIILRDIQWSDGNSRRIMGSDNFIADLA